MTTLPEITITPGVVLDRLRAVEKRLIECGWWQDDYWKSWPTHQSPACITATIAMVADGAASPSGVSEHARPLYDELELRIAEAASALMPPEKEVVCHTSSLVEINDEVWQTRDDAIAAVRHAITTAEAERGETR